jgi:hypothetical protein
MLNPGARTKCIHVKLDRITHKEYKKQLLELDSTMQEAFEIFARSLANGSLSAINIVRKGQRDMLLSILNDVGLSPQYIGRDEVKPRRPFLDKIDSDRMYDLIGEYDSKDGDGDAP